MSEVSQTQERQMREDRPIVADKLPPPDVSPDDRVTIMKPDLERIRNNLGALIYFASRITGIGEDKLSIVHLKQFEVKRFHEWTERIKNHSFSVSLYLDRISELERQLAGKEAAVNDLVWAIDFLFQQFTPEHIDSVSGTNAGECLKKMAAQHTDGD